MSVIKGHLCCDKCICNQKNSLSSSLDSPPTSQRLPRELSHNAEAHEYQWRRKHASLSASSRFGRRSATSVNYCREKGNSSAQNSIVNNRSQRGRSSWQQISTSTIFIIVCLTLTASLAPVSGSPLTSLSRSGMRRTHSSSNLQLSQMGHKAQFQRKTNTSNTLLLKLLSRPRRSYKNCNETLHKLYEDLHTKAKEAIAPSRRKRYLYGHTNSRSSTEERLKIDHESLKTIHCQVTTKKNLFGSKNSEIKTSLKSMVHLIQQKMNNLDFSNFTEVNETNCESTCKMPTERKSDRVWEKEIVRFLLSHRREYEAICNELKKNNTVESTPSSV